MLNNDGKDFLHFKDALVLLSLYQAAASLLKVLMRTAEKSSDLAPKHINLFSSRPHKGTNTMMAKCYTSLTTLRLTTM